MWRATGKAAVDADGIATVVTGAENSTGDGEFRSTVAKASA